MALVQGMESQKERVLLALRESAREWAWRKGRKDQKLFFLCLNCQLKYQCKFINYIKVLRAQSIMIGNQYLFNPKNWLKDLVQKDLFQRQQVRRHARNQDYLDQLRHSQEREVFESRRENQFRRLAESQIQPKSPYLHLQKLKQQSLQKKERFLQSYINQGKRQLQLKVDQKNQEIDLLKRSFRQRYSIQLKNQIDQRKMQKSAEHRQSEARDTQNLNSAILQYRRDLVSSHLSKQLQKQTLRGFLKDQVKERETVEKTELKADKYTYGKVVPNNANLLDLGQRLQNDRRRHLQYLQKFYLKQRFSQAKGG